MPFDELAGVAFLFLRTSAISFGGIYSVWALTERALFVTAMHPHEGSHLSMRAEGSPAFLPALDRATFDQVFAVAQVLPGPMASGISMLGYASGGLAAMAAIYVGLAAPGAILAPLLLRFWHRLRGFAVFRSFAQGAALASIGVLLYFALTILGRGVLESAVNPRAFLFLFGLALLGGLSRRVPAALIVCLAGVGGYFLL